MGSCDRASFYYNFLIDVIDKSPNDFIFKKMQVNLTDFQYWMSSNIGLYPKIYFPIYTRKYPFSYLAVNSSTEICIEGYPRCANSYAVYAFKLSNKDTMIGHHLHVPAQIIKSVAMELPTVVVIRNPKEAVTSFLVFQSSTNANLYLKAYIKFYKSIMPLLNRVLVANFPTIIDDFNKVIRAINNKFGTSYQIIPNLNQRQDEIFKRLKEINIGFFKGDKDKNMYPDESRGVHKQQIKKYTQKSKFLAEADKIYKEIIKLSV